MITPDNIAAQHLFATNDALCPCIHQHQLQHGHNMTSAIKHERSDSVPEQEVAMPPQVQRLPWQADELRGLGHSCVP